MKINGLFLLLLCFLSACSKTENTPPPNILFLLSDDHTAQAWGIYDGILQEHVVNTNIQRIAQSGAILNNAFCTNSICVPSRGSILTGQYSHRNDIYTLADAMHPDSMNIAKALQAQGYQTALFGKWHLKKQPAGFDEFKVLPGQGVYHNPKMKGKDDWVDGYKGGQAYPGFSSDVITDFSLDWLSRRDPNKPFFLLTHFKATHEPFDYPERHAKRYQDIDLPEPASLYDFDPATNGRSFIGQKLEHLGDRWEKAMADTNYWTSYPGLPVSMEGLDSLERRRFIYQKFVKDFLRCGAAIDDNIGRLLDYLETNNLAENTVVIYTADQGYFLGEHGFFDKRLIYEESLRMPFVICYPKEIKGGTRLDDLVLNIDFPALFADYAGLEKPAFIQGRSFRDNLKGQTAADWRQQMYYRYWLHRTERPGHFGIRNERYKLAFFYGQPLGMKGAMAETTEPAWEFYDLQKDPTESWNAYADPGYAEIVAEMKVALKAERERVGDTDEQHEVMQEILAKHWE